MTPEYLAEIRARLNAATPAPWYVVTTDDDHCMSGAYVGTEDHGEGHDNRNGLATGGGDPETVKRRNYSSSTCKMSLRGDTSTYAIWWTSAYSIN